MGNLRILSIFFQWNPIGNSDHQAGGHGEWLHKNAKVSIEKIRESNSSASDYGTFSLVIRDIRDTDNNVVVLERYDNLTLDPTSPNYIARQLGDRYYQWDSTERRLKEYGDYPNQSRYVRVVMNDDADAGATDATLLPFGYYGPPKFSDTAALDSLDTTLALAYTSPNPSQRGNRCLWCRHSNRSHSKPSIPVCQIENKCF